MNPALAAIALGDRRVDDYAWLREKEDPEVLAHLAAENAYTKAIMTKPDNLAFYGPLADLYIRLNYVDQAEQVFEIIDVSIERLRELFGLTDTDLNLDLGPLGKLL